MEFRGIHQAQTNNHWPVEQDHRSQGPSCAGYSQDEPPDRRSQGPRRIELRRVEGDRVPEIPLGHALGHEGLSDRDHEPGHDAVEKEKAHPAAWASQARRPRHGHPGRGERRHTVHGPKKSPPVEVVGDPASHWTDQEHGYEVREAGHPHPGGRTGQLVDDEVGGDVLSPTAVVGQNRPDPVEPVVPDIQRGEPPRLQNWHRPTLPTRDIVASHDHMEDCRRGCASD